MTTLLQIIEENAASAFIEAGLLGIGNTTFRCIPVGGKFRFKGMLETETCFKTSEAGWYRLNGRRYRTGVNSACFKVSQ